MPDLETQLAASHPEAVAAAAAAAQRFVARAADSGDVDVAYAWTDSPLGRLLLATTARGLVRVAYGDDDQVLSEIATRVSPRMLELPQRLDPARRELDEYFSGARREFDVAVDLRVVAPFAQRVLAAARRIAYGEVATYRDVAVAAGNGGASRAAGNALGANPVPIVVPCHRVVRTGGGLGGYTGGLDKKVWLLQLEGAILQ